MKQYKICWKKTVNANSSKEALDKGVRILFDLIVTGDLVPKKYFFYEIFDVMEIHDNSSDDDDLSRIHARFAGDRPREPRYDPTDLD